MSRLLEDDHDGLTPERKNELQLALKTPLSMPNTQSEIADDRERRAKAMLEINVSDLSTHRSAVSRHLFHSSPRYRDAGIGSE